MGFYFPNIDKPKCCAECPCIDEGNTGLEPYCPILKTIIYDVNAIHKDCIMVETKSPHGRLIDADKLLKSIEIMKRHKCETCECRIDTKRCNVNSCWMMFIAEFIEELPSVIEAEGKGK